MGYALICTDICNQTHRNGCWNLTNRLHSPVRNSTNEHSCLGRLQLAHPQLAALTGNCNPHLSRPSRSRSLGLLRNLETQSHKIQFKKTMVYPRFILITHNFLMFSEKLRWEHCRQSLESHGELLLLRLWQRTPANCNSEPWK
jgi:hypothetical protein